MLAASSSPVTFSKIVFTTSKCLIEFTYSDSPFHLKVNRAKLSLINRRWKCNKGERLTITSSSLWKIDQHDNFTRAVSRRYRDRGKR